MIINIALLPPRNVADVLRNASRMLGNHAANGALLGVAALPHVTVAQLDLSDGASLTRIIAETGTLGTPSELTLAGLCLLRGPESDVWVESPVLKSSGLAALQTQVLEAVSGYGQLVSGCGDGYRPHATLGYFNSMEDVDALGVVRSLSVDLRSTSSGWTLAVGHSGRNYTFERMVDGG